MVRISEFRSVDRQSAPYPFTVGLLPDRRPSARNSTGQQSGLDAFGV
jgi:hypothetical protein